MQLGGYIRLMRKELGLSVTELAKRANLSQSYLSQIECGDRRNPSLESLKSLAEALGTPVERLESLVESESVDRLRLLLRDSQKAISRLPRLVADAENLLARAEPEEAIEPIYPWLGGEHDRNAQRRTKHWTRDLAKLISEFKNLNSSMPQLLGDLNTKLESPRYPERAEALLLRADRLGDSGLGFLGDMILSVERLTGAKESGGAK